MKRGKRKREKIQIVLTNGIKGLKIASFWVEMHKMPKIFLKLQVKKKLQYINTHDHDSKEV